ncbi:hypothetical protein E2C01_036987 [Portunus trituberculatus]|uniref:Uncharacterized protein n=1 Tax=Portunus trituberculatus TaxID=210409 RepID=A0A5B7FA75_PORTR|nr:hypothetical protein [Portunus trituberculatus]
MERGVEGVVLRGCFQRVFSGAERGLAGWPTRGGLHSATRPKSRACRPAALRCDAATPHPVLKAVRQARRGAQRRAPREAARHPAGGKSAARRDLNRAASGRRGCGGGGGGGGVVVW